MARPGRRTHLHLALVDDVEVVALVTLLYDGLAGQEVDREHGVEDVRALVLVQVGEEDVLGDGLAQGGHCLVVLRHHLQDRERRLLSTCRRTNVIRFHTRLC